MKWPKMPTDVLCVENGLPVFRPFTGLTMQPEGGPPVKIVPGAPVDDVTDGSSPKIWRAGLGGGNTSFGGLGSGGVVMVLPTTCTANASTWFARDALRLMFS